MRTFERKIFFSERILFFLSVFYRQKKCYRQKRERPNSLSLSLKKSKTKLFTNIRESLINFPQSMKNTQHLSSTQTSYTITPAIRKGSLHIYFFPMFRTNIVPNLCRSSARPILISEIKQICRIKYLPIFKLLAQIRIHQVKRYILIPFIHP